MTLSIKNLTVQYKAVTALKNITLSLEPGKLTAIIGRNGSGKTTLLKSICGLAPLSSGEILFDGQSAISAQHRIAYLPQKDKVDLNFPVTVRGVVEMGRFPHLGWTKAFRPEDEEKVSQAITTMKLNDLQDRHISELSGGQQQRTYIARALAQEADVLLLDEPYSGLDEPSQDDLTDLLNNLANQNKMLLVSHHDIATVRHHFPHSILVNQTLIVHGSTEDILTQDNLDKAFYRG